jgi:hypothetical protein
MTCVQNAQTNGPCFKGSRRWAVGSRQYRADRGTSKGKDTGECKSKIQNRKSKNPNGQSGESLGENNRTTWTQSAKNSGKWRVTSGKQGLRFAPVLLRSPRGRLDPGVGWVSTL